MGLRESAALEVATHVHFEPEASAGVEKLDREQGLIGLPAHESIFVAQTPAPVVVLVSVCGDAALDELAVGRLDVAEEPVRAAKEGTRLDVARRREESPHPPLQPIVEW